MEESLSTNNLENTDSISNAVESQLILFPNSSSNEPLQEEIEEDDILEEIDPVQAILPEIELELADPTEKLAHPKKKYCKISNEKRLELIDSVENQGQKIKDVANRLSINYSSAKSICQVFKKEGRKDKKAFKNRIINEKQENPQSDLMLQNAPSSADSHYPASQSKKIETENPEQAPEKDSLMELRDRLLKSRLGKREEFDDGQGALTHEKQTQTSDNSNNNNYYNSYNNGYANMQQQHQFEQNAMNQQRQMYQQLGQQNFMNNSNNQGFQQSGSMQTEQNKGNQTNTGDNSNNNMNRYQPQQVYMYNQMPQQQHFIMVTSQPQHQSNLQGYIYQQNQSNSGQYSNNNNNNMGQSNSNTSTNVQNFYINDSNTTTFYPSQNLQMNQGYQVLNQGQGQGQGQGQYYITSNSDTNNGQQQGYQMVQPMMMMIPMNQSMQQGYFAQSSDNNYNQQQNSYMLVRGNQNQNQNQNQIQGNMQNQSVKDIKNEGGGQVSSDNIEK